MVIVIIAVLLFLSLFVFDFFLTMYNATRWEYLQSLEDKRLPLDAIYQIRDAKTVDDIKDIIATRDKTLNLKDQKSYE